MSAAKFAETMARLRVDYLQILPGRLADVGRKLDHCVAQPEDASALVELKRMAHTLAGTAGTFGQHEVGQRARLLEQAIGEMERQPVRTSADIAVLRPLVAQLIDTPVAP